MDAFLLQARPRLIALVMAAFVTLLLLAQLMYLLWPEYKQYQQLSASYQLLKQASSDTRGLQQALQETTREVDKIAYRLHGDMAGLPEKQLEAYIIGQLQKVSWNSGVELASVIPGQGRKVQMFREALFKVKLSATYQNLFKWLQSINNELGFIVVKKFDIRASAADIDHDPQLQISLTLVSYRLVKDV